MSKQSNYLTISKIERASRHAESINEIAKLLGVTRQWLGQYMKHRAYFKCRGYEVVMITDKDIKVKEVK